jgi:uncharacterized membrane protein
LTKNNKSVAIVGIIGFLVQLFAFFALWMEWTGPFNYLLAVGYLLMAAFFLYLASQPFRSKNKT